MLYDMHVNSITKPKGSLFNALTFLDMDRVPAVSIRESTRLLRVRLGVRMRVMSRAVINRVPLSAFG